MPVCYSTLVIHLDSCITAEIVWCSVCEKADLVIRVERGKGMLKAQFSSPIQRVPSALWIGLYVFVPFPGFYCLHVCLLEIIFIRLWLQA